MKVIAGWKLSLLLLSAAGIGIGAFIYSGIYNIGADAPHTPLVYWLTETLRERSIAVRASAIEVPHLDDADSIASGGSEYTEMCAGCHLQPGEKTSEISAGLYPQPPDLTKKTAMPPAQMFWIIKHGVKMTAMPAWGPTHDDQRIWAMVAFLQRLPDLTQDQYQLLTAPEPDAAEHQQHDHH